MLPAPMSNTHANMTNDFQIVLVLCGALGENYLAPVHAEIAGACRQHHVRGALVTGLVKHFLSAGKVNQNFL